MSKYKYLLKNIGLLTISNFGSKILSFILIPLYTNVLTTSEYGIYDVYATTVSLLIPILTLNIVDGVMRFALDEKKDKRQVFSIGIKYVTIGSLIFSSLVIVNNIFNLVPLFVDFSSYLILLFVSSLFYTLITQFSRGIEKITDVAVSGIINSIIMLGCNVLFLLYFKMGIQGYFLATCLSFIIPSIYLVVRLKIWKYIVPRTNSQLTEEITDYSKPIIFDTVSWWVTNVSDRYVVTWFCGIAANGIYSLAYKIPSILNVFQSIFTQAWTLSAVKSLEDKDSSAFYSSIYEYCNCGIVVLCSILILMDKILAKILFANEFYLAWKYAPFLMISVVFGILSGLFVGIFAAAKQSKTFSFTTVIGAAVNIIFNILLVYFIGPLGASIATLLAYIIVWMIRLIKVNKIVTIKINLKKDIVAYSILITQSIILILEWEIFLTYLVESILLIVIFLIYSKQITGLMKKILAKFSSRSEEEKSVTLDM